MQITEKKLAGQFSYYSDGSQSNPVSYLFAKDLDGDGSQEVLFVAFETQPNTPGSYSNTSVHIFGWEDNVFQNITSKWLPRDANLVEGVGDVAFGDFNGDGLLDVFLSAYTDMDHPVNAYELINRGGAFEKISLGSATWMHAVASADVNNDGFDDVISAGYASFHQFLGSPSGLEAYDGMVGSSGIALGDFLGDGTVTAIFVDAGTGSRDTFLYRLEINQQNQPIDLQRISTLPSPRLVTLGLETDTALSHDIRARTMDFNGDGLQDVVVFSYLADYSQGLSQDSHKSEIQFLLNHGAGQFQDVTEQYRVGYDVNGYVGYFPQVADFNYDGLLDIFTSSPDWMPFYNSTTLLMQQQDGHFLDTDRTLIRNNITDNSFSQGVMVSGPNQTHYLVSESKWDWSDPVTKVYVQTISFPEREMGEVLSGNDLNNNIYGFGGNDSLEGRSGNDFLDGGLGFDTAHYLGAIEDYEIVLGSESTTVRDRISDRDGADALFNIERLGFSDSSIALDIGPAQNAGSAYRLYKAAFDRAPDLVGLGYWIDQLDDGASLELAASGFIQSEEFQSLYGINATEAVFVTKLYNNVLDRSPDSSGYDFWLEQMSNGMTRESVLINFSESDENIANVANQIADGIYYQEWLG